MLKNPQGLPFRDFARLVGDMHTHAEADVDLVDRWIGSLQRRASVIARDRNATAEAEVILFWIRLHGALVELPCQFQASVELLQSADAGTIEKLRAKPEAAAALHLIVLRWSVHIASEELGTALDREEHIYADWRRQTEAHVKQSAYGMRIRKGSLQESLEIKSLGCRVSNAEAWEAIRSVRSRHAQSDAAVAAFFADKLTAGISRLALAQDRYREFSRTLAGASLDDGA